MTGLIDTGASCSVLRLATFERISHVVHRPNLLQPAQDLQSVTGERLQVIGATEIKVGGLSLPVTVRVVRALHEELILGCDVLADSIVDLEKG